MTGSGEQWAAKEPVYRRVIADLRSIGYEALAEELELEANVLYGNPNVPVPIGILTGAALIVEDQATVETPADVIQFEDAAGVHHYFALPAGTVATIPPLPDDSDEPDSFLPPAYPGAIDP